MEFIDTHIHLEGFEKRGEIDAVLLRARAAGVTKLITVGTASDDWALYQRLAKHYHCTIYYTVGLHPCSVDERWSEQIALLEQFWENDGPPPVALGECGLDRFHLPKDNPPLAERTLQWQKAAFAAQLALAARLSCPLVVHSRGAFAECIEMIAASGVDWARVVFHCFTEGPAEMDQLTRLGGRGSFTGVLSYKNAEPVRQAFVAQGLARLMLETDAPYLAPVPHRGKENEPAFLRDTAEAGAKVLGVPLVEIAARSTANAQSFFALY
jgi:TatD DNase family protein